MAHRPKLLWLDSLGGLGVGIVVLAISGWIATLHGLPPRVVMLVGAANVIYGCFSLSIQLHHRRTVTHIALLSSANVVWLGVCLIIVLMYRTAITPFGVIHLIGEGLYVAGLGVLEWRRRGSLVIPP